MAESHSDEAIGDERPQRWPARFYLKHEKKILGTITVVVFITIWELAGSVWPVANPIFLSWPSRIWHAGVQLYQSGKLVHHLYVSGVEFFWGYFLSILVGVPLGGRTVSSDFLSFSTTRSGVFFPKLPWKRKCRISVGAKWAASMPSAGVALFDIFIAGFSMREVHEHVRERLHGSADCFRA